MYFFIIWWVMLVKVIYLETGQQFVLLHSISLHGVLLDCRLDKPFLFNILMRYRVHQLFNNPPLKYLQQPALTTCFPVSLAVLCADRVGQMTKTYSDIDAVTRLLEEVRAHRVIFGSNAKYI